MRQLSYLELDSKAIQLSELEDYSENPAFRKATVNMVLATRACAHLLERHHGISKSAISFVLGTAFGEVKSSLDFLKTHKEEGLARPNLFQNSLHNSTLGFVTVQLGLRGPAITVSSGKNTRQATELTARTLLHLTEHVLVCLVDVAPPQLELFYREAEISSSLNQAKTWLWKRKT